MAMKSLLVPVEPHDGMNRILETALLAARRFDSHIEGFALTGFGAALFAMDPAGGFLLENFEKERAEWAQRSRALFESFMAEHGIPRRAAGGPTVEGPGGASATAARGPTWGWREVERAGDDFVGDHGRVFDLIVLGRPSAGTDGPRIETLEAAIFDSGRPVLIAPPEAPQRMGEHVLVAWNASTEQARTMGLAMPFVAAAQRVTVLTIEGGMVPGPSGGELVDGLAYHGISAEHRHVKSSGRPTGEVILTEAASLGCDLIVKGAYTQSRLRQIIFGGATRHLLFEANLPIVMAH